ncbi:MAG: hypothetical protein H6Q76_1510 [Firmicutes bacterium]|nr:hypothetical protein [Bacillota bacterium]
MDDKTCDLVMTRLIYLANNTPGVTLSLMTTKFGDFFPSLSINQVLPTLKLLTDQGVIKATNLEGSYVQIFMPAAAFGYFDAKRVAKEKRAKDRRWELFKITFQAGIGFVTGIASTLLVQFLLKTSG